MYYPKALITTDLYTNGGEYIDASGKPYTGYYWQTYDGKNITGKNPQDKTGGRALTKITGTQIPKQDIAGASTLTVQYNTTSFEYQDLTTRFENLVYVPYPVITPPTNSNYEVGSFTRYFCKRNNGEMYMEIDQNQFNKLSKRADDILWQLYTPFSMFWKLTGDREQVFQTNKNLTQQVITTKKYYRFADFLKNQYLLYYKE